MMFARMRIISRAHGYTVTPEPEAAILNSPRYHHLVCVPEGRKTILELHWRLGEEGTDDSVDQEVSGNEHCAFRNWLLRLS